MKKFNVFIVILLLLQLFLPFSLNVHAQEKNEPLQYLALGDSLAAGMNENYEIGYGYGDFIALNYIDKEYSVQFNKGFSFPGYTTVNVLEDIQSNVTRSIHDLNGPSQTEITLHKAIEQADLITLSAGANDVLKHVNRSQSGEFSFDLPAVLKAFQEVAANYEKIFAEIQKINPEVDILIMGLYNPFPYRQDATLQTQLNTLVATMNNSIKAVVEKNGGVFSDVADTVAKDYVTYLPNPNNIHLGKAGYEVVAEKMLSDYMAVILNKVEDELNDTGNIDFYNFKDTENHWAREYIHVAYKKGILKGYDGTFQPNINMTRVQVVSVLTRAFGLQATKAAPFKDIGQYDQQTQNEIAAAYEAGVINENNGIFNPKGELSRAQLALMLLRLSNTLTDEDYVWNATTLFKDIEKYDAETKAAISFLCENGIVEGTSATTFAPGDKVTRAQLAKIIVLMISK